MKFSEHFGLNREQPELDFVDVDPERDLPLFIDPYALSKREDYWSALCTQDVVGFFQTAVDAIRAGDHGRARALLDRLSEPNETCLGLSKGRPSGRGVSGKQAFDLYDKLAQSRAVQTGLLSELSDAELVVEGIGEDKLSDITTNIVRHHLIRYTQDQCRLHGIPVRQVASGRLWDAERGHWWRNHVELPVVDKRMILLVPKAIVRWNLAINHREYYDDFVLNFLRTEEEAKHSSLVRTFKNGRQVVTKKALKEWYPLSKDFLYRFTREHPEVLRQYKATKDVIAPILDAELATVDEPALARAMIQRLQEIPPGSGSATAYHRLMVGILEFLFYPDLIYPEKERKIHGGRKRIDIIYRNAALTGLFQLLHRWPRTMAALVMVECKNYVHDPENPELDQLAGRFSPTRGWFGLLLARTFLDKDRFIRRCRDTAGDGRGFIVPLADDDIVRMLEMVIARRRSEIDHYLNRFYTALMS